MRTLVITDLHLNSKVKGLLGAQVECVLKVFFDESPGEVIIMGDIFMHRKPSPSELLGFKSIIDRMKSLAHVVILRGNHDSETKADDGKTALLLYEDTSVMQGVKVITHTFVDTDRRRVFIPHYENEETIIEALDMATQGYQVFGHFGYVGCLNSVGDYDSSISLSHFHNNTLLGHIHGFCEKQGGLPKARSRVVCLGTPYTTNYAEAFKDNYYAILDDGGPRTPKNTGWFDQHGECSNIEFKKVTTGPRHLVYAAKDVEDNLETINDPDYFTFLRVMVGADHYPIPYDKLKVAYLDIRYAPVFDEEETSKFTPERDLFSVNEMIISDYVDGANSKISRDLLMEGYRLLKNED